MHQAWDLVVSHVLRFRQCHNELNRGTVTFVIVGKLYEKAVENQWLSPQLSGYHNGYNPSIEFIMALRQPHDMRNDLVLCLMRILDAMC